MHGNKKKGGHAMVFACLMLLLAASAAAEVSAMLRYVPDSGAFTVSCSGLYANAQYSLLIQKEDSEALSSDNLLFADSLAATENGQLHVAFIHMNLPDGVVKLGGPMEDGRSPRVLGAVSAEGTEIGGTRLPAALKEIGDEAFLNSSFSYVFLGDKVTKIGARAFKGCAGLVEIHIPNSVTFIGEDAFAGCENLVIVTSNAYVINYAETNSIAHKAQ